MAGSYLKSLVKCPFYSADDAQRRINCEGLIDGTQLGGQYFRTHELQERYIRRYCSAKYTECLYAQALLAKYKEDANG